MIKAKLVLPDVAAVPSKEQSDWNVNDPEDAGYIKNRTHYKEDAISYIPITESNIITFNDVAGRYVAAINNASLTEGVYKVVIRGQEGVYESTKVDDTYNILVTNPDGISFSYIEGTNFITVVDETATTSYQTSLSLYLQDVDTTYHKLGMEYIPSDEIADEIFPTLHVEASISADEDDIVTIKRGIRNNEGSIENTDEEDIVLAKVAKTGSYNDLSDNPEIPTKTSDLTNDGADGTSPFVTESQIVPQVQSNWTENNSEEPSFIQNKPSIKAGTGTISIVEGDIENNVASGENSHAEGDSTIASGDDSHAEGYSTEASGESSHAEGSYTIASGKSSHAEGSYTTASSWTSHAEGSGTTASGESSHAEGGGTTASGESSHAEGIGTTASGYFSHAEGYEVTANHKSQHVFGEYNVADTNVADATQRGDFIEIVGNGTANNARSNARTLDWNGNETLMGNLTVGGTITANGASILPQVQADWEQNNSAEVSFVRNRTHYIDNVGTVYPSVSITLTVSSGYAQGSMYGYGQYPAGFWNEVKGGRYLTLTVGDTVFEGEVKSYLDSRLYIGNGYLHMPNLPDTGEGWCYYCDSPGFDSFHLMCDESMTGTYSASVFPHERVYIPLDERFIPDTITRNSDLVNASVAYAHDITPELSDAIEDDAAFIWQTSGGSANIPPKATAVVQSIQGNSTSVSSSCSITQLKSRIYNLFDYQNDTVSEHYKLDYEGALTSDADYNVYWVHVMAGVDGGNNGYVFTPAEGYTLNDCGFSVVAVASSAGANPNSRISASTHGNSTSFLPANDCWLAFHVLRGYEDKICLHFAWSGYNDGVFGAYEEDVLSIHDGVSLRGIGSVCDEIVPQKHIQRIGVGNTKNYTWERWTEEVYDIETQQYVDVFQGWKTTSVTDIALTTNVIMKDYVGNFSSFYTGGGTLFAPCSSENNTDYEQLTSYGIDILYELKDAIETAIQYNGLITVGDFGDMKFDTDVIPSDVVIKYGINYRDTIRNLANSGVTFSSNGVLTSGLFFGQPIVTKNLNGSSTWTFSELKTMMRVVLQGADNAVTLPVGGENPFRFQIIVVQDSTGGRNLSFSVADSGVIYNPSEFDFTSGEGGQLCICTMIWTGNEYLYECTPYVGA